MDSKQQTQECTVSNLTLKDTDLPSYITQNLNKSGNNFIAFVPNLLVDGFLPHKQQAQISKAVWEYLKSNISQISKIAGQSTFIMDEIDDTIVNRTSAMFSYLSTQIGTSITPNTLVFRGSGWKYLDLSGFDTVIVIKEPELQISKVSANSDQTSLQKARAYEQLYTSQSIQYSLQDQTLQSSQPTPTKKVGSLITLTK